MPRINIEPLKKAGIRGVTGEMISGQNSEMNIEDFIQNVKLWENLLRKEGQK